MPAKILIIDDDLQILKLIGLMLERRGHSILAATGGLEGLAKAKSDAPDLIILDVMMDDLDGLEVCRRLRAQPDTARTPILIFTAKSMVSDKVAGFQAGADDYLVKPIHPNDLITRVETALQRSLNSQLESDTTEKARIIGFVGVRGGVGTTTLAINVGAALASTPPARKVVLMDLQGSPANVAVQLNATPSAGLISLLHHAPNEITPELVSQQLIAHPSGLQLLLPSINVHGSSETIPAAQMQTLLNILSRLSQAVIIDAGNNIDYNALIALNVCHRIVLVIEPQRLAISVAQTLITQLDRHGIKSDRLIIAVVNRSSSSMTLDKRAMESALKLPISVLIPPEPDITAQAADQAALILYMQPNSIISDQFRSLAQRIMQ
jgi:DNA-binding response OmpR family regulator